ncbi:MULTISPECIES: hypothetical protein [Acidobacteriaceae]|uniref:hypothetical protein n=1 Tax=Acidobacteriaceae TaxID=204434 RepID=UPI00131EC5DB|nr:MULTISPECIES: hypothetical protein [Acidobacteriaceae]MDW5267803.1 hypothetical protein [Edaphobacter sp.]
MTKKQLSMLQRLSDLLSTNSVRDWAFVLSEIDPTITADRISKIKTKIKARIRDEEGKQPDNGLHKFVKTRAKFPASQEDTAIREFILQVQRPSEKFNRPSGEEFSKWLNIISAKEGPIDKSRKTTPKTSSRNAKKR